MHGSTCIFWANLTPFSLQALADYAAIIESVRAAHHCATCPVLSFGGSYSGKLSAYLRLKYPTVVDMALAASAPIKLDSVGLVDPFSYYEVVTRARWVTHSVDSGMPYTCRASQGCLFVQREDRSGLSASGACVLRGAAGGHGVRGGASEKDTKLVQKLVQLQSFIGTAVPQECMGQLASFGPT
jgi:hypothetical protein